MNRNYATTIARFAAMTAIFLTTTLAAFAGDPEIQVLFYKGDVALETESGRQSIRIGQALSPNDNIRVGRGGSIQISINGKVVSFNSRRTAHRIADILGTAGEQNNPGVARAIEALAAATRMIEIDDADASIPLLASLDGGGASSIEVSSQPQPKVIQTARLRNMNPVILEPRATSVTRGPLRFSWLGASNVDTYLVRVRDRYNDEIFRFETADTTFLWEGAVLFAASEYTWELSSITDTLVTVKASFSRLSDLAGMSVEGGESQIRLELGSKNPALPVILAAHFSSKGCYADAARYYIEGARLNPEHSALLITLALDQYRSNIRVTAAELNAIEAAVKGAK